MNGTVYYRCSCKMNSTFRLSFVEDHAREKIAAFLNFEGREEVQAFLANALPDSDGSSHLEALNRLEAERLKLQRQAASIMENFGDIKDETMRSIAMERINNISTEIKSTDQAIASLNDRMQSIKQRVATIEEHSSLATKNKDALMQASSEEMAGYCKRLGIRVILGRVTELDGQKDKPGLFPHIVWGNKGIAKVFRVEFGGDAFAALYPSLTLTRLPR